MSLNGWLFKWRACPTVPWCRLLNMGIFRAGSHKIRTSWIQVRVNGSAGLGPGPCGALAGAPPASSDRRGQASAAGRAHVVAQMSPGFREKSRLVMCPKGSHVQTQRGHEGRGADGGHVRDSVLRCWSLVSVPRAGWTPGSGGGEGRRLAPSCLKSRCLVPMHTALPPLVHPHDIPGERFSNAPISQVSRQRLQGCQACTSETTQLARVPGEIRTQVSVRLEILSRGELLNRWVQKWTCVWALRNPECRCMERWKGQLQSPAGDQGARPTGSCRSWLWGKPGRSWEEVLCQVLSPGRRQTGIGNGSQGHKKGWANQGPARSQASGHIQLGPQEASTCFLKGRHYDGPSMDDFQCSTLRTHFYFIFMFISKI